ncbi:adenine nucleotide alpha hydrolase [Bacillus sp. FJAT-49736]|uniref:adenine nucleotide alpha hydrolase n=1 Tax=Bacillus sp. FJAT-49736 TaxID=2833582 RepID=UPI001BC8E391|nr:adenine nucleotide alpha hydrolase [Bacillus sp. FJAT-49736]MBS4174903.1 adenine nucleotide alpha hydrolase [Bacillus sp. FJAT-49736]
MKERIVVSFSGGKDCALAMNRLMKGGKWEIDSLLTTVTDDYNRTSMHGVREELLEKQADSLGVKLRKVRIPSLCSNEVYQEKMAEAVSKIVSDGIRYIMFGDIHLRDVKEYREKMLEGTGLEPIFPIWGEKPEKLIKEYFAEGFHTRLTCVDSEQLNPKFVGCEIDDKFLEDYPGNADICGENGEYHTFVFDGPIFSYPIKHTIGEKRIANERFYYVDIVNGENGTL